MKNPNRQSAGAETDKDETTIRRHRAAAFIGSGLIGATLIAGCEVGNNDPDTVPRHEGGNSIELEWTSENVPEEIRAAGEAMTQYDCSVVELYDTHQPPATGFDDGKPRTQVNFKVRLASPERADQFDLDTLSNVAVGGIMHYEGQGQVTASQFEVDAGVVAGTFSRHGTSPMTEEILPDGSTLVTSQFFPRIDLDSREESQIDVAVFLQAQQIDKEGVSWMLDAIVPCGVMRNDPASNTWAQVRPDQAKPSTVERNWQAAAWRN